MPSKWRKFVARVSNPCIRAGWHGLETRATRSATAALLVLALCSCDREERDLGVAPASAVPVETVSVTDLHPAGASTQPTIGNKYDTNAYALSEGKRIFTQFNCGGCHSHGGGGMGPPLMDVKWIYGSSPQQIRASILQGRPNGMPSWQGRIPDYQVWQIVAYVRSMAGLVPNTAAPGRDDHMQNKPAENSMPQQAPVNSGPPADLPG